MKRPLSELLQDVEWEEYRLGDLFEIKNNPQLDKDAFIFSDDHTGYPYFTRTVLNNGLAGYVEYLDDKHKIPGSCLAIGMMGMKFFYMERDFYAGQFTKRAIPRTFELTPRLAQFFISILDKFTPIFLAGSVKQFAATFSNAIVSLPTLNGELAVELIERFVAELEAERLAELEAYLKATGLNNTTLTPEERGALTELETIEWEAVAVTDFFRVHNTRNILASSIVPGSGKTPYVTAMAENNSVSSYIDYGEEFREEGNCVFIGGKTFVVSYQNGPFFSNDSHNLALYAPDHLSDRLTMLFLVTCVAKSMKHKYSWGNSISRKKIESDYLIIPVMDGKFAESFARLLMRAVQKLVIKDVAAFTDRRIMAARSVIEG